MSIGLKNAPTTFQLETDVIIVQIKWQHAIVYIGDIIVLSKTKGEFLKHIDKALLLLMNAGVAIKLKKFSFSSETINYLGHLIALSHLQVAQKTTESIKMMQYPTTVSEMRSFMGF